MVDDIVLIDEMKISGRFEFSRISLELRGFKLCRTTGLDIESMKY